MKLMLKKVLSPTKIILSLCFIFILLTGLYMPSTLDFVNIMTQYMPFIMIAFAAGIMTQDKDYRTEEILYIQNRRPWKYILEQYLIVVIYYFILLLAVILFYGFLNVEDFKEGVSVSMYFLSVGISGLYFGTLAMTIAGITKNSILSYGFTLMNWLYWNVNYEKVSIFNPFPFLSNLRTANKFWVIQLIIVAFLLSINLYIVQKSPFYFKEKAYKIFVEK